MNSSIYAAVQTIVVCMILCGSSNQTAIPGMTAVFQKLLSGISFVTL